MDSLLLDFPNKHVQMKSVAFKKIHPQEIMDEAAAIAAQGEKYVK